MTCSKKFKICCLILSLNLFSNAEVQDVDNKSKKSPNIIFILADDLGWNDVGFHGMTDIPTPNIDSLAADSIVLNNYYVQPVCTPSRAALMTGLYPIHTGTQHYVIRTAEAWGLPLHFQTLPQRLKKLNYVSRIVGKWHLGFHQSSYTPLARGFYSHYGFWPGAVDFFSHKASTLLLLNDTQHFPYYASKDRIVLEGKSMRDNLVAVNDREGEYMTHVLNEKALDVIKRHNQTKPLFLYLAHHAVHRGNARLPVRGPQGTEDTFNYIENETRRNFAGVLKALDDSLGDVVEALQERGMLENSIIVFSTDNGAEVTTTFPSGGSNYPLRGQKYTAWEGGVKGVSMIWSPLFKNPRISEQLFHIVDWMPTLYHAAGGNARDLGPIDGIDMWKALKDNLPSPRREALLSLDPVWGLMSIREDNFKLICGSVPLLEVNQWYDVVKSNSSAPVSQEESKVRKALRTVRESTGGQEGTNRDAFPLKVDCGNFTVAYDDCFPNDFPCLFDLQTDPCERRNLAAHKPQILNLMLNRLRHYQATQSPVGNTPNDFLANPQFHDGFWSSWVDLQQTVLEMAVRKRRNTSDSLVQLDLEVTSESVRLQAGYQVDLLNHTDSSRATINRESFWLNKSIILVAFLFLTTYVSKINYST